MVEDTQNAFGELLVSGSSEGEVCFLIARDGYEGLGVVGAVAPGVEDEVVASFLAFLIEAPAEKPDGRVEEEEGFEEALEDNDEVVVAAKVGEFMGEDSDRLFTRETAHE